MLIESAPSSANTLKSQERHLLKIADRTKIVFIERCFRAPVREVIRISDGPEFWGWYVERNELRDTTWRNPAKGPPSFAKYDIWARTGMSLLIAPISRLIV